jgi:zinc protease
VAAALIVASSQQAPGIQGPRSRPRPAVESLVENVAPASRADRRAFRTPLASGAVAYLVRDPHDSNIELRVAFRAGSYLDPAGKEGLSNLFAHALRYGGTRARAADALDAELDRCGARLSVDVGATHGNILLQLPSGSLEAGLDILFDVLRQPAFSQASLDEARARLAACLAARDDAAADALLREWRRAARGNHYSVRLPTAESLAAIGRDDLAAAAARYLYPKNMIFAAAGGFDNKRVISLLDARLAAWPNIDAPMPVPPDVEPPGAPGIYCYDPGTLAGTAAVAAGFLVPQCTPAERAALDVLVEALCSPAAAGRLDVALRFERPLATRIEVDRAPSDFFSGDVVFHGSCMAHDAGSFLSIIFDEWRSLQAQPLSSERLAAIRQALMGRTTTEPSDARSLVRRFCAEELGRVDPEAATRSLEELSRLTPADCLRAARRFLVPENGYFVIYGPSDAILGSRPTALPAGMPVTRVDR